MAINHKILLNSLIVNCPVPVKFGNVTDSGIPAGEYWSKGKFIKIDSRCTNAEAIAVLFHEIKHSTDDIKGKLNRNQRTPAEYRAASTALQRAYRLKDKAIIKRVLEMITYNFNCNIQHSPHYKAAVKIMRLKTWSKCLEFIKCQDPKVAKIRLKQPVTY